MIQVKPESDVEVLEDRLSRGADLLFDMERRGEIEGEYERYLEHYTLLLREYEQLKAA